MHVGGGGGKGMNRWGPNARYKFVKSILCRGALIGCLDRIRGAAPVVGCRDLTVLSVLQVYSTESEQETCPSTLWGSNH